MKTRQIFPLVALVFCFQWCAGQNENKEGNPGNGTKTTIHVTQPCMVLKVDDMTMKVDNGPLAKIKLDDINANWISTIDVLKDQKAIELFGEDARSGAVVITFKDFKSLSRELQEAFNETKKVE